MELVSAIVDLVGFSLETSDMVGKVVVHAAPLHRGCTVMLKNESSRYTLSDPRLHTRSGFCSHPLPPTIPARSSGEACFIKAPVVARGAVGVFTYDLVNNSTQLCMKKLVVMYKVPFDLNIRSVEFAVGVFDIDTECNKQLFRQISRTTDQTFVKGKVKKTASLSYSEGGVTVKASMSSCYTPVMIVQVSDSS